MPYIITCMYFISVGFQSQNRGHIVANDNYAKSMEEPNMGLGSNKTIIKY